MESIVSEPVVVDPAPVRSDRSRQLTASLTKRAGTIAQRPWAVPAWIGGLLVLSTLMRLRGIHFHYWIDEGISVGIASHPLSQIPGLLRQDGAPPLWYALLHVWMSLFGTRPVATHTLSLIFAQLTIPAGWWAARPLGRRAAVFASLLLAGVPYLTAYAEETRMYSLMVLLGLLLAGAFLRAFVERRRGWMPAFVLALTAAMYTHNWGLFLAVASAAGIVACLWLTPVSERRALLRDGIITLGATFILYLPWLPTTLFQAAHTGAPWAVRTTLWTWTQGLYFIGGGRDVVAVLFVAGIAGLISTFRASSVHSAFRREVIVLALLVWVTFAAGWVLGKLDPSFSSRYEAAIVGPLALIVALALSRSGRIAVLAVALCCTWWVLDPRTAQLSAKSNVAAVAAAAGSSLNSQSLVLSTQPEQVPTLHYYMPQVQRFATPVGFPGHDYAVNWVNLLGRMENPATGHELHRLLATVAPGQTVGIVIPIGLSSVTTYLRLVNHFSTTWWHFLEHDPDFTQVLSTRRSWSTSGNPVELAVYRRR
ncbi:MAG TPA: glycosyltransferase family 39 protein [Solirubrobacteraceae bacterium]|nr:glycosyltransferase family 39 protein [Solirubrobacteraceae bacterium]